jgi:hypothetical protein
MSEQTPEPKPKVFLHIELDENNVIDVKGTAINSEPIAF